MLINILINNSLLNKYQKYKSDEIERNLSCVRIVLVVI